MEIKTKNRRNFTINKKRVQFKLADSGSKKRVDIEAKRFKSSNYYTRITKKANGDRKLWVCRKTPQKEYKLSDFKVMKIQRRVYGQGSGRLFLVNVEITNKITKQKFNDWVRTDQINTGKQINKLIAWK